MLLQRLLKSFTGIAVALLVGATAIPAFAEDSTLRVSNPPSEFVIGDPKNPDAALEYSVFVNGPTRATISVEFVDFVYGETGEKENLPANTTPYSLAKVLSVEKFDNEYQPSESGREIKIVLVPKKNKINMLYFGGIKIKLDQVSGNSKKNSSASPSGGILSQVNVTPFGWAGGDNKTKIQAAQFASVSFSSKNRTSIIDYIVPDLPGLVNTGPIEAKVRYENKGELPVFTSTTWKFISNGKPLATKSSGKSLILAGKDATRSVITQSEISGSSEMVNVLPGFGVVDIETTLLSEIGGTKLKPQVNKSSVLIVQWKEPFFFIALGLTFVWYVLRKRPAKPGQKRKEPSLLRLAIKALRKEAAKRWAKRGAKKPPSV